MKELISNLLTFILWINIKRPVVKKRINDWELLLNYKFDQADKNEKKKISSFKNKIKKLK
jgi:hypothetical protein